MKILIIDNYDSFTFNLYQVIGEIIGEKTNDFSIDVVRNDKITLKEIQKKQYERIILSPGPGDPKDRKYFGVCADILLEIKNTPILGVCLGMQGIGYYFGGNVIKATKPMHGKTSKISHNGKGLFTDLPQDIEVMRYHSLIIDPESLPNDLEITATAKDTGEIMGLQHKKYPISGIQFHPESFGTEGGRILLSNFLFSDYSHSERSEESSKKILRVAQDDRKGDM